jgi:ribosome-associated toxin RatA of RatAB toxin-antitoxin module
MPKLHGAATAVINAPIERCYEVAADPEHAPEWQPEIKVADVIERNDAGEQVLVHNEVDGKVKTLKSRLRFTYDPPTGLQWSQVEGDLNGVEGSWVFKDLGDGTTEATCEMEFDLGRVLGMAIRGPVADLLRKQLVETMPEKLKAYCEA